MPELLLNLPTELLYMIVEFLDESGRSAFRQTCWSTRNLVIRQIFRHLRIDFSQIERARRQLRSLALSGGISATAVSQYTQELTVWPRGVTASDIPTYLIPAIPTLQRVKIVNVQRVTPDRPKSVPPSFVAALTSLPSLEDFEIHFSNYFSPQLMGLPPLKRLGVAVNLRNAIFSSVDLKLLVRSLRDVFACSQHSLEVLELNTGCSYYQLDGAPMLGELFRGVPPLRLRKLSLNGWRVDAESIVNLMPHMRELTALTMGIHILGDLSGLWAALQSTGKLQRAHKAEISTSPLIQRLSRHSGLVELKICPQSMVFTETTMPPSHAVVLLRANARSLKVLHIDPRWHSEWNYTDELAAAIWKCRGLKALSIAVTDNRLLLLLRDAAEYRMLEMLAIASKGWRQGWIQEVLLPSVAAVIVPPDSALQKVTIEKGTAWFALRRVGARLVADDPA